jgi:hypothetical protein
VALIGDLIISLQYFDASGKIQERDTIIDINEQNNQLEKRT